MRLATLLLALLAAPALAQGDPQPPEPWRFYPLAVGNAWEYGAVLQSAPFRREIVRDTLVGLQRYAVMVRRAPSGYPFGSFSRTYVLRYDARTAQVVELQADGTEAPFFETPCSLNHPFGPGECVYDASIEFVFNVRPGVSEPLPGAGLPEATISYDSLVGGHTLASDLGLVSFAGDAGPGTSLTYARIDGVEVGMPRLAYLFDEPAPASYFPLAVGHAWEYEVTFDDGPAALVYRDSLAADTLLNGTRYLVQHRVRIDRDQGVIYAEPLHTEFLRFDEAAAHVVRHTAGGGEEPYLTPCPFDVPFGADPFACGDGHAFESAQAEVAISIGPREAPTDGAMAAVKTFTRGTTDTLALASGLGVVRERRCADAGCQTRTLHYAHVGAEVYGEARLPGLIVEPDPYDPSDYYPLAIGNAWEYSPSAAWGQYSRREIVRDTVVDGTRFFVVRSGRTRQGITYRDSSLVRYDSERGFL